MAFEKGNTWGKKGREFEQAVKRALAQDEGKRLRECAETLLTKAAEGEPWAVYTLRDTLDGKPAQTVNVDAASSFTEAISGLAAFLAQAASGEAGSDNSGVGEGGPVLPPQISPTTH